VSAAPTASADSGTTVAGPADGGAEPDSVASCKMPDSGFGDYGPWLPLSLGRMMVPGGEPSPQSFDLLIHFHGGEAAAQLLAPAGLELVLIAVDAGVGSQRYTEALASEPAFLNDAIDAVREVLGGQAALRYLIITSWSAGYGAVRQLLQHDDPSRLDAVVLLDGLHAGYRGADEPPGDGGYDRPELETSGLEPFVDFARRAQASQALMIITHSAIRPPGYASTTETASYLLAQLGGQRRYAGLKKMFGVTQQTLYRSGKLEIRGFTGTTPEAHCAHLRMLLPIVRDDVLPGLRGRQP